MSGDIIFIFEKVRFSQTWCKKLIKNECFFRETKRVFLGHDVRMIGSMLRLNIAENDCFFVKKW